MVTTYVHENTLEGALCRADLRSKTRNKNGLHRLAIFRLIQNGNDYSIISSWGEEKTKLVKSVSMIYQSFKMAKEEFDSCVKDAIKRDMEITNTLSSVTSLINGIHLQYEDFNTVYQGDLIQDHRVVFEGLPSKNDWQVITFLDNHYEYVALNEHGRFKSLFKGYETIKLTYSPPITIRDCTVLGYFDARQNICVFDVLSVGKDSLDTSITTDKYKWHQRRVMLTDMLTRLYGPGKDLYNPTLPIYLSPYNSQPESKVKVRDDLKVNKLIAVRNINDYLHTPITAVGWD